jgi:hypothetical protein
MRLYYGTRGTINRTLKRQRKKETKLKVYEVTAVLTPLHGSESPVKELKNVGKNQTAEMTCLGKH